MTRQLTPREIDELEFKAESRRVLERALAYSAEKRRQEREKALGVDISAPVTKTLFERMEDERTAVKAKEARDRNRPRSHGTNEKKPHPNLGRASPRRKFYIYKGKTHTLRELAEIAGLPAQTIQSRLRKKYTVEQAVETARCQLVRDRSSRRPPTTPHRTYTANGQTLTVLEWAKLIGVTRTAIEFRLTMAAKRGTSLDEVLTIGHLPKHRPSVFVEYEGERLSLNQLSKRTGIALSTLRSRVKRGISDAQITAPVSSTLARQGAGEGRSSAHGGKTGGSPLKQELPELGFICSPVRPPLHRSLLAREQN